MAHPRQQAVYEDNARLEVAPYIPRTARRAVDVGCGRGGFGRTLRDVLGDEATILGLEPVEEQAAAARLNRGFDDVVTGWFPEALGGETEQFDLICFNDVLEHLVDPWSAVADARELLAPGGRVVAAIPSIQYLPVVVRLLRGRWDYADEGTLDRTHLRFFTRATMVELFEESGFVVEECAGVNSMFMFARYQRVRLLRRLIADRQWIQFVVVARKAH